MKLGLIHGCVVATAIASALPLHAQSVSLSAVADTGSAYSGVASTPIADVTANDILNDAAPVLGSSGNATISQVGDWPSGISLNVMTGAVNTTAALATGTYSFAYQLCDLNDPADCAIASDTIAVSAGVVVADDTGSSVVGTDSVPIANAVANDTVNGAQAVLGDSGNAKVAQAGAWPDGIALNTSTGGISVTAALTVGVYSVEYELCDLNDPPNCASTNDTITVSASIGALAETGSATVGIAATPISNVAANDTINGSPAVLGESGNAAIMQLGTWPDGIALNVASGAVNTAATVTPGTYSIQYQLCDLVTPADCASTTDSIIVSASIGAVSDAGSTIAGIAATPIANVAANDTVNGAPASLGVSGNATVAEFDIWPSGILLDGPSGAIGVTAVVASGVYSVQYQLCDLNTPVNCATATDTVTVAAAVPTTVALPDNGSADAGVASKPIANVAANDTINSVPATLGVAGNATIAKVGTWPVGISLNTATGLVSTTTALVTGTYNFQYRLCDKSTPAVCSTTTESVTVNTVTLVAAPDSGSADAGVASKPIANVLANDTVNGAAVTLGTSGNATIAKVGTWPSGIGLNTSTGVISTTSAVAAGTYSVQYSLCDKNKPPLCATAAETITLSTPSIKAQPDIGSADAGIASKPVANVVANDALDGAPVTLGASGNATIAKIATWPAGLGLNVSTGLLSTTPALSPGVYSVQYRLCDKNVAPFCVPATVTVTVVAASIGAAPDSGSVYAGAAAKPIANVAANDTINGIPATLGLAGNATIGKVGTWPAGIALNASTGLVSTAAAVLPGTYTIQYHLCDKNVPPACATTTDTITVTAVSIAAMPDSGSAFVGVPATPILNIVANDSLNSAAVSLGASGNGTIATVGTWPTGLALDSSTGAVTTTGTLAAGDYTVQYRLCDKSAATICTTAIDTVSIITASIGAAPDQGSVFVGAAYVAIANVTANDTVNGLQAMLGASGNAAVSQIGDWPGSWHLDPSSGAITTAAATPAGTYSVQYQLCDRNTPANCAVTIDTVSVSASVQAMSESGNSDSGSAAIAIANVAGNDIVNGIPATLGAPGNATISQSGTWPAGIALDPQSGAITITALTAPGSYNLQYQLCDTNSPVNCSTATDTVVVRQAFTEVQVSPFVIGDIEFDWGRDGIYCATCNFNKGNARFNWTDRNGNLWVGHIDPNSGAFTPAAGNNELADTSAFSYVTFANGPEWAFSTQAGQVVSQLIYTRYTPGTPATAANAGAAMATPTPAGWTVSFLPGAIGTSGGGSINTVAPVASQCNTDSVALGVFFDLATPRNVLWEPMTTSPGTAPTVTTFGSLATRVSGDKPAVRWIPCTHQLIFMGAAPADALGNVYQQVYWNDIDDPDTVQQLTSDAVTHTEALIFQAPEFNNNNVLITIANGLELDIYEQTGVGNNGAPTFQLINRVTSPDPAEPYIIGTEPFVNCTPSCQSYVFMKLSSIASTLSNITTVANGLGVTNINPAHPLFKLLVQQVTTPTIQRMDLEYYITTSGPYLYYQRNTVASPTTQFQQHGAYYIDMQLGAPSGSCVGSSAEGGMLPGC